MKAAKALLLIGLCCVVAACSDNNSYNNERTRFCRPSLYLDGTLGFVRNLRFVEARREGRC